MKSIEKFLEKNNVSYLSEVDYLYCKTLSFKFNGYDCVVKKIHSSFSLKINGDLYVRETQNKIIDIINSYKGYYEIF